MNKVNHACLTNLELLRLARNSALMDDPLFSALVERFEEEIDVEIRIELDSRAKFGSLREA